jgi:alpha-galactosidase
MLNARAWIPAALMLAAAAGPSLKAQAADAPAPLPASLTPPPPDTPRINGPGIFGVRPGSPFLYAIPATGMRPIAYAADGLPPGLSIDPASGLVTGALSQPAAYPVILRATNPRGSAQRSLRIVVGSQIALTPPMGWNSWNCWGASVDEDKVLAAARAMAASGLKDHGWSYINTDDTWQGVRGGPLNAIQPNAKFPDMAGLGSRIHAMGLKFGLYSTPWRGSYEGHIGSSADNGAGTYDWIASGDHTPNFRIGSDTARWNREKTGNWRPGTVSFAGSDAAQMGLWGIDYLKYDWFPNDVPHVAEIAGALGRTGRDIVLSLSNTAPYDSASDWARLSNAWRTTGDIRDTWKRVSEIGFGQDRWAPYAGPGHWNDPDMLVVGLVGWGPKLHASNLTPDEQYAHISLWCLLSAPLIIGCDIARIDPFTLGLLTNDEVLALDQDALGREATQVANDGDRVVYSKTLEDGSVAVGIFNRGASAAAMTVTWGPWGDLTALNGTVRARDLWRQKDLGAFDGKFGAVVPSHGVVLVRLEPAG